MISFFECLGYKYSTESDFKQFWDFFSEHFTQVDLSNLTYRSLLTNCLLYTSPSPRDRTRSRMPSSA